MNLFTLQLDSRDFMYPAALEFAETTVQFKLASGEPSHKLERQRLGSMADRIKETIRADCDAVIARVDEEVLNSRRNSVIGETSRKPIRNAQVSGKTMAMRDDLPSTV